MFFGYSCKCFGFAAKRARMETVPVNSVASGRTLRIQKSTGFGQLIAGEAITIRSNLSKNRREVAMMSREFLANDVCQRHHFGGLKAVPWGLDVEITGGTMLTDHKYVSIRYGLNLSEDPSKVVVGETPVEMKVGLRKGHFLLQNKSSLGLSHSDWKMLLSHGRQMITELRLLDEQSFESFEDVNLPEMTVIRETPADGFGHRQTTAILLTVTLAKKQNDSDICSPVINIREYAEDVKNDCFVATQRGIGLGLKAFYMLCFPVAEAARKMHDLFLTVKVGLDDFFDETNKQFQSIQDTLKREGGIWKRLEAKDDELTKDERRVTGGENILDDNVEEGLDIIAPCDLEKDALSAV
jgi:hypothetical protein